MTYRPISAVSEFNDLGILIQFPDYPGAYARGVNEAEALAKTTAELTSYALWAGIEPPAAQGVTVTARVRASGDLRIDDADSEILLDADNLRLPRGDFTRWQELALRSACCVQRLYDNISDKNWAQPDKQKKTFYGKTPSTAREMYSHIEQVCEYYLSRLSIYGSFNSGNLIDNRRICAELLDKNYSVPFRIYHADGEYWTETKVLRRFLWHDRIHAKAMFRHALKSGMRAEEIDNAFGF